MRAPLRLTAVSSLALVALLALPLASLAGCKPELIPGTNLEDTEENRAIMDFLEQYRVAVESRDAEKVLALVAEEYFEDNGTQDQTDDYGIEKLRGSLAQEFQVAEVVQLTLNVQHIEPRAGEKDRYEVYYRYLQRALLDLPAGDRWVSNSDVNRMIVKKKGDRLSDGFLIVSGL